jgi:quercetin 2,3-dioxygenase
MYCGLFQGEQTAQLALAPNRKGYVHLVRGELDVNGTRLTAGDAALLQDVSSVHFDHGHDAEVLVFDLHA